MSRHDAFEAVGELVYDEQTDTLAPPSRRDEVLAELLALRSSSDAERAHVEADRLLLKLIGDDEIRAAFDAIRKWYA